MSHPWSAYQEAVYNFISNEKGNAVVEAVAGSGKSTTLEECCHRAGNQRVLVIAFNKFIAEAMQKRVPRNTTASTLHSFGLRAMRRVWPNATVEKDKERQIALELGIPKWDIGQFCKLVSMAKAWLVDDVEGIIGLGLAYQCLQPNWPEKVQQVLEISKDPKTGISFDDMIWLPVVLNVITYAYDLVFIDETQDLNRSQMELALKAAGSVGRIVAVGDSHQCQPTGTLVKVLQEKGSRWQGVTLVDIPIEQIKVGDRVVGYSVAHSSFVNSKRVNAVSKRKYRGPLVKVETSDGRVSRYTPEHRCLASFKSLRDHFAVYLMRRNKTWRIGISKLKHPIGVVGLSARMSAEKADAVWVLETHKDRKQALLREAELSVEFGIPMMMFTAKNNSVMTQDDLDVFWTRIGDNQAKAEQALTKFGRELRFPLVSVKMNPHEFSISRPREIQACNMISGLLVAPHEEHGGKRNLRRSAWMPVDVSREAYNGTVHSLEVDGGFYCADGIVTHNSIYAFRGADSASMGRLTERLSAKTLPLSISYRCPVSVVREAQKYVPQIESAPNAPPGVVQEMEEEQIVPALGPGDAVISRTNAPLVRMCLQLLRAGTPAWVRGRDIGSGLTAIVNKSKTMDINEFARWLGEYHRKEHKKLQAFGDGISSEAQEQSEILQDRVNTLIELSDGCSFTSELTTRITGLFEDRTDANRVILSSTHRAKGLEFDNVYLLWDTFKEGKQEERNLCYVAITRSKGTLTYVQRP